MISSLASFLCGSSQPELKNERKNRCPEEKERPGEDDDYKVTKRLENEQIPASQLASNHKKRAPNFCRCRHLDVVFFG